MVLDARDKAQDVALRMKLALLTADPERFMPLLFAGDPVIDAPATPKPVKSDFDPAGDTAGEWKFTEAVDPRDAEAILAGLMDTMVGGTISSADLGEWQ